MSFVRNAWYMGAWSHEVGERPLGRTLVGEPVVMFRDAQGAAAALLDVCPHRAVPLSLGTVTEGRIRCPYHGLEYDGAGVCRHNPHVKGPPDRIRVARTFPVLERDGIVWVWPGDPELADPARAPEYGWFASSDFATGFGYLRVEADYRLMIDNLMDLAHAEYIHPDTVGTPGSTEVQQVEIVARDGAISVNTLWPDLPPNAVNAKFWRETERIDEYLDMTWRPVSNLLLDIQVAAPGAPRHSGLHTPSAHILTPETERSTHYFWAFARDFQKDDAHITEKIVEVVGAAFNNEDKPILEAAQRRIDQTGARLLNFTPGDAGSARVRREIERLAALEQDAGAAAGRRAGGGGRAR